MRLATILKVLVVLVVAVVVAGVVVLMNMDFNQYKGLIAEKVKDATGRDLVIEGDIGLALSLTPAIAVDGIRFQNASWGSRPDMAVIERFEARVALWPLLSQTIEVKNILLKGADILIERDRQGRANYEFDTAGESRSESTGSSGPVTLPLVHEVLIEDARLTYADAATGEKLELALEKVALTGEGPTSPVDVSVEGSYNAARFLATGRLGPARTLTDPSAPWPVTLTMKVGGAVIDVVGSIRDAAAVEGVDLALRIAGESLAGFSDLAGGPVPPIGPYAVSAKVGGGLAKGIRLDGITARVGKSDLEGALEARLDGPRPAVKGAFRSSLLDLSDFTANGGDGAAAASGGGSGGGGPTAGDGRIFPADPLPVGALKAADADITFDGKRILVKGAAVENVKVGLSLKAGRLKVAPVTAEVAKGTIDGDLALDAAAASPALATKLKAAKIDLGKLLNDMEVNDLLDGALNADMELRGSGGSVRALMAGLDGDIRMMVGKGRVKSTALDTFIGGPTQILGKMVSGETKEYTALNCVVSVTEIRGGMATLKAAAIDTEYARITGKGTVNLATERLDIGVAPEPKSATINLAVGIKIGGTLAEPSYGVDELSALRKLGGLALGAGFPPALILGLGEVGVGSDSPCVKPTGTEGQQSGGGPASAVGDAVKGVTEGAGNVLKDLFGK